MVRSTGFSIENLFGLYVTIDKEVLGLLRVSGSKNHLVQRMSSQKNLTFAISMVCLEMK